jgi:hypothetical protein
MPTAFLQVTPKGPLHRIDFAASGLIAKARRLRPLWLSKPHGLIAADVLGLNCGD